MCSRYVCKNEMNFVHFGPFSFLFCNCKSSNQIISVCRVILMHLLKVIKVSYIWFPVSTYSYNFSIEKPKLEAILSTFENVKMEELSDDSWNYFREDPLLHAFHNTYHTVLSHLHYIGFSRTSEIFQYMHQQLLRRSIIIILSITHHFIEIKR